MKIEKNLMLLVLLSLFVSVGVADSNVTEVNASEAKDDLREFWGLDEMDEAMEEADEAIEANKASIERAKKAGAMEEALAANKASIELRDAIISAILRK